MNHQLPIAAAAAKATKQFRHTLAGRLLPLIIALLGAGLPWSSPAQAPNSSFTYQGLLSHTDGPADGDFEMEFRLHADATEESQVGVTIARLIGISDGLFTTELDFENEFDAAQLWIELAVRPAGDPAPMVVLAPRQKLTAAPVAKYALSAGSAGNGSQWGSATGGGLSFLQGSIGIGTQSPADRFTVYDGNVTLQTPDNTQDQGLQFQNSGGHYSWRIYRTDVGNSQADLRIGGGVSSANSSQLPDRMVLAANGHVGVGGSPRNPHGFSRVLNVHGSSSAGLVLSAANGAASNDTWTMGMCSDGTLCVFHSGDAPGKFSVPILEIRGGSDIAEPFNVNPPGAPTAGGISPAAVAIEPGIVVAIDPDAPGELRIANRAYDPSVAGIISGAGGVNAGMILSQEGTIADGEHPVALTGRVWAWCDADANGAVLPGDMLTTSSTPGHAMKASDREKAFGSILGKAMTPLQSGRGLVLVLVSLQ